MKNEKDKNIFLFNSQTGYQYEFDIHFISIKIEYKAQFNFKILIKRGSNQNEIDTIYKYDPQLDQELPINEEFSIVSVLYPQDNSSFDFENNQIFADKKYKIYICIYTKGGFKPAIGGEINLADFINKDNENIITLSNKTFSEVILKFRIKCKFISVFDPNSLNLNLKKQELEIPEINKLSFIENKKDEEIFEKNYLNTISTNRTNSIFSNLITNLFENKKENETDDIANKKYLDLLDKGK